MPLTWFTSFGDGQNLRRVFSPADNPHVRHTFCGHCGTPLRYWTEQPLNTDAREWINITVGSLGEREQELLSELDLLPEAAEEPQRPDEEQRPSAGVAQDAEEEADDEIVRSPEALERQQLQVRQHQQEQRQQQQQQQMGHPMMPGMMASPFGSSSLFSDPGWSLLHPSPFDDPMPGFGSHGIPWFEDMLGGSQLGRIPRSHHGRVVRDDRGSQPTRDGNVQWEVREWVDDNGGQTTSTSRTMHSSGGMGMNMNMSSFSSSSSSSRGFPRKQRRTGGDHM